MLCVVSGLLVSRRGTIFMGRRHAGKKRGGLWELPGGKVEEDETPRKALRREWREELALDVEVTELVAHAVFDLEVRFKLELYEVRAHSILETTGNYLPTKTHPDHSEIAWVDATYAVEYMPCSPGYYAHYSYIMEHLRGNRS